jgi:NAD(P)H dehydrogenase (quinone)
MNILIVYAHPNHHSFNAAILKQVQSHLSKKHSVQLLDLYAENFDPILRFDNNNKRRNLKNLPQTKKYRNQISWADKLIFIFPIWWGGMPAILKGYIDSVFVSGFAYSNKKMGMDGHLNGKSAWIITTHNTPSIIAHYFSQDYGKVLKKQVLKACSISPIKHTDITSVERLSEEKLKQVLGKVSDDAKNI